MNTPAKPKYRTTNWKQYKSALKARGSLLIWLTKICCWHGIASSKRGRSQAYSEMAIQFGMTIKSQCKLALQQAPDLTQSLLELASLDWPVPDYSTLSRCQKHLAAASGEHTGNPSY